MKAKKKMDRREFLRDAAAGSAGLAGLAATPLPETPVGEHARQEPSARENDQPNIVLIMADDMGFSDLGCYGSEIDTPNIDRLAGEGVRFSQFYNAARCCPTRASLLTGLYPHQAGVGHMRADLDLPAYRGHLNDRCVTIAEVLGQAGYDTAMVGKWHLGQAYDQWPLAKGFDRYTGLLDGASHYFDPPPSRALVRDNKPFAPKSVDRYESRSHLQPDFYMTDFFSDWAARYTKEHARGESPFFLYLSYTAPHWPIHAPRRTIEKYRGRFMEGWDALREQRHRRLVESGLVSERWTLPPRDSRVPAWSEVEDREAWDHKMAAYAAMVDRMDHGIGRVLQALDEQGVAENTLVLFLSDNGAASIGLGKNANAPPGSPESYMGYHRPWANLSDTPFRKYKIWTHEGGIATPFIARWPGRSEPGSVSHEPGHVMDVMPTCLEAAGASYPSSFEGRSVTPPAGRSLTPVLQGESRDGHDALYWSHTDNHAVRSGRWKLVSANGRDEWQLYDMEADRTETNDLASKRPDAVSALAQQHEQWRERVGVLPWSEYKARRKQRREGEN
jgi:arylsulfatase